MRLPVPRRGAKPPANPHGEMSLVGHLAELRTRLIRSVIAVTVAAIVVYAFFGPVFDALEAPYCEFQVEQTADSCEFLVTAPLESFNVRLTLAGYGGLILALPVVLYQIGRFVLPGLYPNEKKALVPFVLLSVVMLLVGMTVAYLLLPRALAVLQDFGSDTFVPRYKPTEYLGFFVKMLFAFGIAAELPLVLIFLQKIGVVKPQTLARNRRMAVVAVVVLGAIITPTGDPFTLSVVSVPMYLFYEIAILVGRRLTPIGLGSGTTAASR
jgi:sec-independent protein translocase protein TatC